MNGTVGNMDWNACRDCKHSPPKEGGCVLKVPENLNNFRLNWDSIECTKFEAMK